MKILFTGSSTPGHLLPMVPLADAATAVGHDIAFVANADQTAVLSPRALLPAGPTVLELLAEVGGRTGGADGKQADEGAIELFAGARVDMTYDDALAQARAFGPDLIVCDYVDFVAPMIAAALDVPWAAVAIAAALPDELMQPMVARSAEQHAARGLVPRPRLALLDPLPDALRLPHEIPPEDLISLRPDANVGDGAGFEPPARPDGVSRVLVTMGTTVDEPDLLEKILSSVTAQDVDVLVTTSDPDRDSRVHHVGYVPLAVLLPHVDAVVGAGGMGTLLASLAAGLPMVLRPVLADQPWNAARLTEFGVAMTIDDPADAGNAVRTVLTEPGYRSKAGDVARSIAAMNSPADALDLVLQRLG